MGLDLTSENENIKDFSHAIEDDQVSFSNPEFHEASESSRMLVIKFECILW